MSKVYSYENKIVSIHSYDRDKSKWPNSNNFEITIPQSIKNVESIRLIDITLPSNYYTFSNKYENTKFTFKLTPYLISDPNYPYLASNQGNEYTTTVQEGFYTPTQLANEIANKMNNTVTDYLTTASGISTLSYSKFTVMYDSVKQKILIGNTIDSFTLTFDTRIYYDNDTTNTDCSNKNIFTHYLKWGFPYFIGFNKETYNSTKTTTDIEFLYNDVGDTLWLSPDSSGDGAYYVEAPLTIKIFGESHIYMEIDKCNSIDELDPYPEKTNNMYNNDYGGKINSAFVKIPIIQIPHSQIVLTHNDFINSVKHFNPPLSKLDKLKFKFRYHDGILVDFSDFPFNFSVEIRSLRDNILNNFNAIHTI
jgi:hypothetical protein